jgi:Phosphodiester glycosidase
VLRIDLQQEGISFKTNPPAPLLPPPAVTWNTTGKTISEFMQAEKSCVAAINTNFSWPYNDDDVSGNPFVLFGLAVTREPDGAVFVCDPWERPKSNYTDLPDVPDYRYTGCVALLIYSDNFAEIKEITAVEPKPNISGLVAAVAGSPPPVRDDNREPPFDPNWPPLLFAGAAEGQSPWVLKEDKVMWAQDVPTSPLIAARTMIGLSGESQPRYLFLMTIDGNENMSPQFGGTFYDAGEWLRAAGAYNGFCLDGGGSTAMALRKGDQITIVNTPFGDEATPGYQRAVGLYLGVVSRNPEPLP